MNETILNSIYHKIAGTVADTIKESWTKIVLYGEIGEGVRSSFFYYYSDNSGLPVHSHDIPELFGIKEEEYNALWRQLLNHLSELWNEFIKNGQVPWTNLTMFLTASGDFKIEYNYEDLSDADDYERTIIWGHKYLGLIPEEEEDVKFLEEYLSNRSKMND